MLADRPTAAYADTPTRRHADPLFPPEPKSVLLAYAV
jgi:hypothetical protein